MPYFLKRIFWLLPTLLFTSLLIFSISLSAPSSFTEPDSELNSNNNQISYPQWEQKQNQIKSSLDMNIPAFYLSLHSAALSDTLYRINHEVIKLNIRSWAFQSGNWKMINDIYAQIKSAIQSADSDQKADRYLDLLLIKDLDQLISRLRQFPELKIEAASASKKNSLSKYLPVIRWNGSNNKYHHWISSLLKLDLGRSLIDKRALAPKISKSLKWTISLSLSSLLLALLIAIPLAIAAAMNPMGLLDRLCNLIFFALYSVPVFWMASLLLIFLASKQYLHWFPSFGIGEIDPGMSFSQIFAIRSAHLFLPLVCWTYGSLAFIFRQLRGKLIEQSFTDYALTARAKGLSKWQIMWRHLFKNSQFPLITLLGASLPALIGGSFIIESVFSIPGMGKLSLDAFLQRDYPLIFNLSLLACCLTVFGIFLADLAYHYNDPRIKFQSRGNE